MQSTRLVSFDLGNGFSGIVVADVDVRALTIRAMDVCKDKNELMTHIGNVIRPMVMEHPNPVVVLEVIHSKRKRYMNHGLMNLSTSVCNYFKGYGVKVIWLQPQQKKDVGGTTSHRKEKSAQAAKVFLASSVDYAKWLETFTAFERGHDVADALNAIRYLQDNPEKMVGEASRVPSTRRYT
jgi:hypothetical protein